MEATGRGRLNRNANISNALSLYRLCAAPVAAYVALDGNRSLFAILICISLFTDLIDGILARWLHQETRVGARLDALADSMTLIAAILGAFMFEYEPLRQNILWLVIFLVCLGLATMVSLIRFRKLPAFHLYSFKATDVILTGFFITLFTYGFVKWFFVFSTICASIAALEIVLVALVLKEFRPNQKGIYWVLRARKR